MIPSGYSRNVISGKLPGGEIWQSSFWCDEAPSDQAATQSQADAFASDISSALTTAGTPIDHMCAGSTIDTLTTYSYLDATGHATHVAVSNITGGAAALTQTLPDQCCLVVTLLTGVAGRRHRGRLYIPYLADTLSGGQVSSSKITDIAAWWSSLITALNGDLGGQHVVVLSQAGGSSVSVNAVQVDSKIDIQRRRADKVQPASKAVHVVT